MTDTPSRSNWIYTVETFFSRFKGWGAPTAAAAAAIAATYFVHGADIWQLKISSCEFVELLVLVVVAFFATRNYYITFKKLQEAGEDTNRYAQAVAIIFNIVFFACATGSLKYPAFH